MADLNVSNFLASCPTPEAGCFAGDPDALASMLYMDDGVIRATFERAAEASTVAAIEGVPIEEATFTPAIIVTPDQSASGGFEIGIADQPQKVLEGDHGDIDTTRIRIARCGYICGATAVGCPLRTAPNA